MTATPEDLFARFDALGLGVTTHRHPAVYTVEQNRALRGDLPGGHCKNLFLKDHKGRLWLVAMLEDRAVDLKRLAAAIGAGRLSFGSAARLADALGVEPGSVTPFALINDTERRVTLVLDKRMLEHETLNYHPLTNAATTAISPADLLAFVKACGHDPVVVDLDGLA